LVSTLTSLSLEERKGTIILYSRLSIILEKLELNLRKKEGWVAHGGASLSKAVQRVWELLLIYKKKNRMVNREGCLSLSLCKPRPTTLKT